MGCRKYPKFYYDLISIFIYGNFGLKYFHWHDRLNFREYFNSGTLSRLRAVIADGHTCSR